MAVATPARAEGEGVIHSDHLVLRFPEELRGVAEGLARRTETYLAVMAGQLGVALDGPGSKGPIEIYLAEDTEAMLRKSGNRLPEWAAGAVLTDSEQVLLALKGRGGRVLPLDTITRHELSHVLLGRAVGPRGVPLWFNEGFALYQAGEWSFERSVTVARAVHFGPFIRLSEMSRRFPARPSDADVAYALSYEFVAYLMNRAGPDTLANIVRRVKAGEPFLQALESTTFSSLDALEADFRQRLEERFSWVPALRQFADPWILAAALLMVAWLLVRRRRRLRLQRWAELEDAEDRAVARAIAEANAAPPALGPGSGLGKVLELPASAPAPPPEAEAADTLDRVLAPDEARELLERAGMLRSTQGTDSTPGSSGPGRGGGEDDGGPWLH